MLKTTRMYGRRYQVSYSLKHVFESDSARTVGRLFGSSDMDDSAYCAAAFQR